MSEFSDLERLVTAEIDGHFGEQTLVTPRASGRYFVGAPDNSRAAIEVTGIVDFDPVAIMSQDRSRYDGLRPVISGERIHVSYDAALFTDWLPKTGDEIELLARADTPTLKISRVEHDGLGRLLCYCAPAEAAS
jgi:hypothetical protein